MPLSKTLGSYVLLGAGVAGVFYLSEETNRDKMRSLFQKIKDKAEGLYSNSRTDFKDGLNKAGHPDPYDLGDSSMVDEGAMYSVHYFNEKVQQ
ncbi:hypothetical protein [Bacillus massiliglaciei]|uniref:hypothetical protein n=1 Tax=Bacillus massiliglaciei TaxID=1816693 RepID=UPI000DA61E18|nr:hypothetical protein [Bacillus massiliglaciei]